MREVLFQPNRPSRFVDTEYPQNFSTPVYNSIFQFIPSCLWFCFSRVSFLFYFIIFILQIVFTVPLDFSVTLIPLLLTLSTSVITNIIQYWHRKKLIAKINLQKAVVRRDRQWVEVPWQAVAVGDIIKLTNGDLAPADLVLLTTTYGNPCAIDNCMIDGSKQLRTRSALPELRELANEQIMMNCTFTIRYEKMLAKQYDSPNINSKVRFTGTILSGNNQAKFSNRQFIERYSAVYYSKDVICGVIYTGADCRSVQYTPRAPVKFSNLEKLLNFQNFLQIMLLLFSAALISGIAFIFRENTSRWPFQMDTTASWYYGTTYLSYTCLLLPLSPLELYIFVDFVLFIHSLFITAEDAYSISSINSIAELTQVDTVMVTKSNLIGKNSNILRIYVDGNVYGQVLPTKNSPNYSLATPSFVDPTFEPNQNTHLFFLHLCLCHFAIPIEMNSYIGYSSSYSEDESLLRFASSYGYTLHKVEQKILYINDQKYVVEQRFPPSPQHPRHSVIFRDHDKTLIILVRGDIDLMRGFVNIPNGPERQLKADGLHVLCLGYRVVKEQELIDLRKQTNNVDTLFEKIAALEKNCQFLGMIGFEDEPMPGAVPFIKSVKEAGIQLVLTSASKAASVSVDALSLDAISKNNSVAVINGDDKDSVMSKIEWLIRQTSFDVIVISGSSIPFFRLSPDVIDMAAIIQKASVLLLENSDSYENSLFVQFLRLYCHKQVMAVGHSVSDASYVCEANIGVSINVDEISPCNASSDIVVQSIFPLTRLIILHGGFLRERLYGLFNFIFPRNTVFAFLQVCYGFHSALSGTPLFNEAQILTSLLISSAIPAISRAIFNQKTPYSLMEATPDYYKRSQKPFLSFNRFCYVSILSLIGAILLHETDWLVLHNARKPYGDTFSIRQFSFSAESSFVVCTFCFIIPRINSWPSIQHYIIWGTLVGYFVLWRIHTDGEGSGQSKGSVASVTSLWMYWLLLLLYCGFAAFCQLSYILWVRIPKCEHKKEAPESEMLLSEMNDQLTSNTIARATINDILGADDLTTDS